MTDKPPADPQPAAPPVQDETVPLDEFCADISRTDNRVELIAAFAYIERAAKRHHDTPAAYKERFSVVHRIPA